MKLSRAVRRALGDSYAPWLDGPMTQDDFECYLYANAPGVTYSVPKVGAGKYEISFVSIGVIPSFDSIRVRFRIRVRIDGITFSPTGVVVVSSGKKVQLSTALKNHLITLFPRHSCKIRGSLVLATRNEVAVANQ